MATRKKSDESLLTAAAEAIGSTLGKLATKVGLGTSSPAAKNPPPPVTKNADGKSSSRPRKTAVAKSAASKKAVAAKSGVGKTAGTKALGSKKAVKGSKKGK